MAVWQQQFFKFIWTALLAAPELSWLPLAQVETYEHFVSLFHTWQLTFSSALIMPHRTNHFRNYKAIHKQESIDYYEPPYSNSNPKEILGSCPRQLEYVLNALTGFNTWQTHTHNTIHSGCITWVINPSFQPDSPSLAVPDEDKDRSGCTDRQFSGGTNRSHPLQCSFTP